jgi:hypothetical protein
VRFACARELQCSVRRTVFERRLDGFVRWRVGLRGLFPSVWVVSLVLGLAGPALAGPFDTIGRGHESTASSVVKQPAPASPTEWRAFLARADVWLLGLHVPGGPRLFVETHSRREGPCGVPNVERLHGVGLTIAGEF